MSNGTMNILLALITLMGTVITYIVVPFLKSKTTKEQRENLEFWVRIAVNAAEQVFKGAGLGEKKKQYVVDFLNSKGIVITEDQLDALIEAAVFELNINTGGRA